MNILLLGSGGREHAIGKKLAESILCTQLYIAPGNAGTSQIAENVAIGVNDFEAQASFCITHQIEMVVVGPEDPLVNGIYDYYKTNPALKNIIVIGPSKKAAQLEGSKAYAKAFMKRHNIPTAAYAQFNKHNFNEGLAYLLQHSLPIVLKADGLAAGKGVLICQSHEEAIVEFTAMILDAKFGAASAEVVVEQFLDGIELSVFALTNGEQYVLLPEAKDYKRIGEGDTGLNTGGMGAISPVPFADEAFMKKVVEKIVAPTISGLHQDNLVYYGFVFFGLINVKGEPMVIEYNCRMGDPETEVVIPRLENDLVALFIANHKKELDKVKIEHSPEAAATVFCVSSGYPEHYETKKEITHLESISNAYVYHAGTTTLDNKIVSNGGRVLAITSKAPTVQEAVTNSAAQAELIQYEGKYFRRDIGWEFN
jgi:phosphoribosylamine---glycine ligase